MVWLGMSYCSRQRPCGCSHGLLLEALVMLECLSYLIIVLWNILLYKSKLDSIFVFEVAQKYLTSLISQTAIMYKQSHIKLG